MRKLSCWPVGDRHTCTRRWRMYTSAIIATLTTILCSRGRSASLRFSPKHNAASSATATAYAYLLALATFLTVAQLIIASYESLECFHTYFFAVDAVLSSIFLCDFLMRVYCAPEMRRLRARGFSPAVALALYVGGDRVCHLDR